MFFFIISFVLDWILFKELFDIFIWKKSLYQYIVSLVALKALGSAQKNYNWKQCLYLGCSLYDWWVASCVLVHFMETYF